MSSTQVVWLVGAGGMAVDYAKVLNALGIVTTVIGRGAESARSFTEKAGIEAIAGGLDAFLERKPELPHSAIVSVGVEALAETTSRLLTYGVRRILVEKPGALTRKEIRDVNTLAKNMSADVFVGYNRRLYAATLQAQKIIHDDGGVTSMHFEFTEWSRIIRNLHKTERVKSAWLLGNSSHVLDLAFYLGGTPTDWQCFTAGALDWHPAASIFAGAGRTDRGVLFSYQANWDAPGRWGVEILTSNSRLIFRPMETLQIMHSGSVVIEQVPIDGKCDKDYKPGLFEQVRRFMQDETDSLCTLNEQVSKWDIYSAIAGYPLA